MDGWSLLLDLIIVLAAAFVAGAVTERLKIGSVVGYILAGMAIGPSALALIRSHQTVSNLAQIGIALVLFTTGLEFSLPRLRRLGRGVLFAGTAQLVLCIALFSGIALTLGQDWRAALTIGIILSVSSTAIVLRVLRERGDLDANHGKISFGILLIQDVAVVPLVLLVTLLSHGPTVKFTSREVLPLLGLFAAFAVGFYLVAVWILPRAFRSRVMASNRELPILLAIITCAAATFGANHFGLPGSLGAFVAGVLLSETPFEGQIRADVAPLKAIFGTLFFASVGMLADVQWELAHPPEIVGVTVAVIGIKLLANFIAIRAFKRVTIASFASALTLAHVGELGFILVQIAAAGKLLGTDTANLVTSAAILSMLLAPGMAMIAPRLSRAWGGRIISKRKLIEELKEEERVSLSKHFVVVGFGTSGKAVTRILTEAQFTVLAVDVDPKFKKSAEDAGAIAMIGDASRYDLMAELHLNDALALVVAIPDHRTASMVISHAHKIAPDLPTIVRSRHHAFQEELRKAGATLVVGEEELLGVRLGEEAIRRSLGEVDADVREVIEAHNV